MTFTFAMGAGTATVRSLSCGAYYLTGEMRLDNVSFKALYTGKGADVDARIAAMRAAFYGELPRKALVRNGDTQQGLAPVQIRRAV